MKNIIIIIAKLIFLFYSLYLLTYYSMGVYFASEYDMLGWEHVWLGIVMILLIVINALFIRNEINKWKNKWS